MRLINSTVSSLESLSSDTLHDLIICLADPTTHSQWHWSQRGARWGTLWLIVHGDQQLQNREGFSSLWSIKC